MSFKQAVHDVNCEWWRFVERPMSAAREFARGETFSCLRELERLVKSDGIAVRRSRSLPDMHPSFCTKLDGKFLIVLKPGSEQFELYGLAHELGHVVLHDAGCLAGDTNTRELEAQIFAIALLMRRPTMLRNALEDNVDARVTGTGVTFITLSFLLLRGATWAWDWATKSKTTAPSTKQRTDTNGPLQRVGA